MKPILTTMTALAVVLATLPGAEAGKLPVVNIKPKLQAVKIKPSRLRVRVDTDAAARLMRRKKQDDPAGIADSGAGPHAAAKPVVATGVRLVRLAPLPRARPGDPVLGLGDLPNDGGQTWDPLAGFDDRNGSADGGWDPLASADDLGGSSWDPLAGVDGLDDAFWDPLGGIDDSSGSADGGWDPLGGIDDVVGDDYDWQSGFRDDSGWAMDDGSSGEIEIDTWDMDSDTFIDTDGSEPGSIASDLMDELERIDSFDFTGDGLVADDVTAETATEADKAEARTWAAFQDVTSAGDAAAANARDAALCSQGVCFDSDGNPITDSDDEPSDDDAEDDSGDAPATDSGDTTPIPPEFDMGDGIVFDPTGNAIDPNILGGNIDPAPELADPGGVGTDPAGNAIDPNIIGGDIDWGDDA